MQTCIILLLSYHSCYTRPTSGLLSKIYPLKVKHKTLNPENEIEESLISYFVCRRNYLLLLKFFCAYT